MKIIIDHPVNAELITTKIFTDLDERTKWIQETTRSKKAERIL